MGMDFMFAVVPFEHDGNLEDLHGDVPEAGDFTEHLKEGVRMFKTKEEDLIPSPLGLSLNFTGIDNMNRETEGDFLEFIGDDLNGRYLLLSPRREILARLRSAVPGMGTEFRRKFLEVLVRNADAALARYGDKAALVIL